MIKLDVTEYQRRTLFNLEDGKVSVLKEDLQQTCSADTPEQVLSYLLSEIADLYEREEDGDQHSAEQEARRAVAELIRGTSTSVEIALDPEPFFWAEITLSK